MSAVGIHFEYEVERRRSLIYCILTTIVASIPVIVAAFINKYYEQYSYSSLDLFSVYGSYILQYGSTLQYYISFSIRLHMISIRFAALNHFLR